MTFYEKNAWIDVCASIFAGLALAVAALFIFWPWIAWLLP